MKAGIALDTESREIYLGLLRDEFLATESRIQPVIFEQSILQVTNEKERYFQILDQLEVDMKNVLSEADLIEFEIAT